MRHMADEDDIQIIETHVNIYNYTSSYISLFDNSCTWAHDVFIIIGMLHSNMCCGSLMSTYSIDIHDICEYIYNMYINIICTQIYSIRTIFYRLTFNTIQILQRKLPYSD